MAGETASLEPAEQTAAVTADFATADGDAGSSAEEQLVDSNAGTWSVLEPVPDPEPALQTDQEQPMAADSRFSRFTALLKDCLDDVGRVVDREDSTSSAAAAPHQLLLQHHPPDRFPLQVPVVCAAGWLLSMQTIYPRRPETHDWFPRCSP